MRSEPSAQFAAPIPLTLLYGREEQMQRIARRLGAPGERLLTLTGLGGVGKTVLAQAAAARLAFAFRSGACFVPLAELRPTTEPATTRNQVALAIAAALGVTGDEQTPIDDALSTYLRDKELLLILDGCEGALGAAPLFVDLLAAAPRVRILATSRHRLNLAADTIEPVTCLAPPPDHANLGELMDNAAAQLFAARGRRALPSFELKAENAAAVGEICRTVGGLPLAVELAAHWVTLFTPVEIAATLNRHLSFLVTPHVDVPERHRSLLAVFDHSWRLLSAEEQRVLTALSTFQHSFDRQAALAAAACDLTTLASLVNHSLIEVLAPGRYVLHPLVQTLAAGRLA